MDLKKSTETRHEMTERKKSTHHLQKIHNRCRVIFLHSFISYLVSVLFSGLPLLEMKFCRNLSPYLLFFFEWNSKPTFKQKINMFYCAEDEHFWQSRRMHFVLEMNTSVPDALTPGGWGRLPFFFQLFCANFVFFESQLLGAFFSSNNLPSSDMKYM